MAEIVDGIDGGMWRFMIDECLKKYWVTSQPADADEHAALREKIIASVLDRNVQIDDAAWKARAMKALLNAEFWFA